MNEKINIRLNGEPVEIESATIQELLQRRFLDGNGVAVALNGEVVPRAQYESTPLHGGDDMEIVHAVQGG